MPRPRFENLDPEKKKAILDAAAREFAENGFEGASYNRIIANAGVSKGAMYYYFDDKEDLYATVLVRVISEWFSVIGDFPDVQTPEEYWDAFDEMLRRSLSLWREDPQSAEISRSFQHMRKTGQLGEALQQVMEVGGRWATELLRKGRDVGAIRTDLPLELLTELTMAVDAVVDGWLAERWDELTPAGQQELLAQAFDLFRRLCVPGPAVEGGEGNP